MKTNSLYAYIGRRFLQAIPLVLGVVVINFVIIQLAPGDPVTALVGAYPAPPEYVEQVRKDFGLDQPAWKQLVLYLKQLTHGDLGFSFVSRQPVLDLIIGRLGATALMTGTAMLLAIIFGLTLGVISALRPYSIIDNACTVIALVGYSLPVFWLGQVLILFFATRLGWFPSSGMHSLRETHAGFGAFTDTARHLALPVLALLGRYLAVNTRMTRASMMEVMSQDYMRTARAKGLHERIVLLRHGLRNAMLPIITIIGYNLGFLLAGSALVETVFAWPGIGRLAFESISARDYPVMLGIFMVLAIMVIVANLLTDIVVAMLDPRIRY